MVILKWISHAYPLLYRVGIYLYLFSLKIFFFALDINYFGEMSFMGNWFHFFFLVLKLVYVVYWLINEFFFFLWLVTVMPCGNYRGCLWEAYCWHKNIYLDIQLKTPLVRLVSLFKCIWSLLVVKEYKIWLAIARLSANSMTIRNIGSTLLYSVLWIFT